MQRLIFYLLYALSSFFSPYTFIVLTNTVTFYYVISNEECGLPLELKREYYSKEEMNVSPTKLPASYLVTC